MSRGDIMMTGKKRSGWGYVVFALIVFALVYIAHGAFSRRSQTPPPGSIPTVGDAVQKAYGSLAAGFRDKVSLAEFAGMFHRMAEPDAGGELPEILQAGVTDSTGPEHPIARFRAEYPTAKSKAEYHFARIEGIWQLQSFVRVPSEFHPDARGGDPSGGGLLPAPRPQEAGKAAPGQKAAEGAPNALTAGGRAATPCDYVIQPGDTLTAISRQFYGTTRYWRRILEANPGLTERTLRVGRKIRIPSSPEPPPEPKEETEPEPKGPLTTTP